jgi:hypothetical protein
MVSLSNFGLKSAGICVIGSVFVSANSFPDDVCSDSFGVDVAGDLVALFGDSDELHSNSCIGVEVTGDEISLVGTEDILLNFVYSEDGGSVASSMSCSVATEDVMDAVDDP